MRVGVVGANWGRVHIGAFRLHGAEIAVLVGADRERVARVAEAEGVPVGTDDAAALEEVDVVVIASPTPTHRGYVERFAHKPLLCEKPLLGCRPDPTFVELAATSRLWVNYAFPFLATARQIRELLPELGPVARADLRVEVNLPGGRSPVEMFIDVAVHPLMFLNQLLGAFELADHQVAGPRFAAALTNGHQLLNARLEIGGDPGFAFDLALIGEAGPMRVRGGYRPGAGWGFEPVQFRREPRGPGERSTGERDIWFAANEALVGTLVAHLRGDIGAAEAEARGLSTGSAALGVERGLAGMLR